PGPPGRSPTASRSRSRNEPPHRAVAPAPRQPPDRRPDPRGARRVVARLGPRAADAGARAGHDHAGRPALRPLVPEHHADRGRRLRPRADPGQVLAREAPGSARVALPDQAPGHLPRPDGDPDRAPLFHGDRPPPAVDRPVVLDTRPRSRRPGAGGAGHGGEARRGRDPREGAIGGEGVALRSLPRPPRGAAPAGGAGPDR